MSYELTPRIHYAVHILQPDGEFLVTGDSDDWHQHRWRLLHNGAVEHVHRMPMPTKGNFDTYSISPDSKWVAGTRASSQSSQTCIWEIGTGITVFFFESLDRVVAMAFHPRLTTLLALLYSHNQSQGSVLEIRDLVKKTVVVSSRVVSLGMTLVWSEEGNYLAGTTPATVWEVDITKGELRELRAFLAWSTSVCFDPTNPTNILITQRHTGTRLYDVWSGKQIYGPYVSQLTPTTQFYDATFSPDGRFILCRPEEGYTITIFHTNGKIYLDTLVAPDIVCSAVFLLDSQRVALTCGDQERGKTVYVWDINHPPEESNILSFQSADRHGLVGKVANVSFSPDGTKFLIASYDGIVHVRNTKDCSLLPQYKLLRYEISLVAATFGTDNETYYVVCKDGSILTSSNKTFYRPAKVPQQPYKVSAFMSGETFILVFTCDDDNDDDDNEYYGGCNKKWYAEIEIHVISKEGTCINEPYKVYDGGFPCAVSTNGLLAVTTRPDQLMIFDLLTGPTEKDQVVRTESSTQAAFSPSGIYLAIITSNGCSVVIWNTESRRIMKTIKYGLVHVPSCMVWQNDTSLVVGVNDDTIYIESLNDDLRYSFDSLYWGLPSKRLSVLGISPDGNTMISVWNDAFIMWDLEALGTAINMPSQGTSVIPGRWSVESRDRRKWVLGPKGEHLFCLPEGHWDCLDPPGSTHVVKHRRRYRIDVNRFLSGEEWIKKFPKLP